jgi:predicted aspartyl protease
MAVERVDGIRYPYLPVTVHIGSHAVAVEALVDTGFDGYLVLQPSLLSTELTTDFYLRLELADGSSLQSPAYIGTIRVGNLASFPGAITAIGSESLVGRGVIDRFRVILDHGRNIIVEP